MASASVLAGGLDRRMPIANVLNPLEEEHGLDMDRHPLSSPTRWPVLEDDATWHRGTGRESRESSPALTAVSASSQPTAGPALRATGLSSPSPSPRRGGIKRRRDSIETPLPSSAASSFLSVPPRGPPTPPITNEAITGNVTCKGSGDVDRPCSCEQCRGSRYHAHERAHSSYRRDMDRLLGAAGIASIGRTAMSHFTTYFDKLSAVEKPPPSDYDEDSDTSELDEFGQWKSRAIRPPASTAAHSAAKKEAHKRKEKSRRDTQKSFFLSFAQLIPGVFGACTPHRHARNNVEEPANMTALDRAALYMTTQRLVLHQLVMRGVLSEEELSVELAKALPEAGHFVRAVLDRAERYVAELRKHGIQNPNFEPTGAARRARTEARGRPGPAKRQRVA